MTTVEGDLADLNDQLNSGETGLVRQDADTGAITVAADKGGKTVDFTGTDGARTLTGVAAGEYTLKSWSDDGDPLSAQVTLSASQPTAAVVLAPPAGIDVVRITGVVRDDSGAPAPGSQGYLS